MNSDSRFRRPDPFVVLVCGVAALAMIALTLGAVAPSMRLSSGTIAAFLVLGAAPYALTVALTCLPGLRRFILFTTRAVALIYGVFDNFIRYQALYFPTGSADAAVVVFLPFWWLVCLAVVGGLVGAALVASDWVSRSRTAH
jgi:hypothetical protein